jgi:hypothetical protein
VNAEKRQQAIAIAAAIFAARDLAKFKDVQDRRTKFAIDEDISKAQRLVVIIEHKLTGS